MSFVHPLIYLVLILSHDESCIIGIIPALETAHAIYYSTILASKMRPDQNIVLCLSGRGDKDVVSVAENLPKFGDVSAFCIIRILLTKCHH